MIRTRFSPSPTGFVHVGSLRTALFAYLFAKKNKGDFLLRIEDTDRERTVAGAVENLLETFAWAGLSVDEGPFLTADGRVEQKGEYGPYIQSERLPLYQKYAQELIEKGVAYYAFDTAEELEAMRKVQEAHKQLPRYDRMRMRNSLTLKPDALQELLASNAPRVVRFKIPAAEEVVIADAVKGTVRFNTKELDDQVLLKSDGFPTYHLAVVVDDHLMKITHVIRGEEWLSSTPKHILLYNAFGWQIPEYAHLPLLLNADKSKLSKRQGDVSVEDYKNKGYLSEALINFVAFLGWNPGTEKELYTLKELVADFSLEKVSKSGAVFNIEKLNWYNKEYLKHLMPAAVIARAQPWLAQLPAIESKPQPWVEKALALELQRVTTLAELPEAVRFIFALPQYNQPLLVWRKGTLEEVKQILPEVKNILSAVSDASWFAPKLEEIVKNFIAEKKYSVGSVLWPLRVSLSGQEHSPGPFEIAEVLGKAETLARLEQALAKLTQ